MSLCCDFSCLVQFERTKGAVIIRTIPENYPLGGNHDLIAVCSFPESSNQVESIHASTLTERLCYHWCFSYKEDRYAIALVSRHLLASTFLSFLEESKEVLNDLPPTERLDKIWEALLLWKLDGQTLFVPTPKGPRSVLSDSHFVTFSDFDPTPIIERGFDWRRIWGALITGSGVLVVGNSPSEVSNAVFSLLSCLAPLVYAEPVLAFTRLGDPRFADVVNGSRLWSIVGTTNKLVLERCTQFQLILNLNDPVKTPLTFDVREKMLNRTNLLLRHVEGALDDMIDKDPYSNFLWVPIPDESLESIGDGGDSGVRVSPPSVRRFLQLRTYYEWHRGALTRPAFREAFLSCLPEQAVSNRTPEQIAMIEKALPVIAAAFDNDAHVLAVVARHQHLLKKQD